MCGFAGIFGFRDLRLIKSMNEAIKHRGPDGEGYYEAEGEDIMLAHRRLAIIDLSEKGHQPMIFGDKIIVYNGEVYNFQEIRGELENCGYTFLSESDTEVILKAYDKWGEKCLDKFNGMFAFAIWDRRNNSLFCARDRFGIKPFYYYYNPEKNILLFASEIKSILQYSNIKWEPNEDIIYEYLFFGLIDHKEETFFKDIKRLPAGTFLNISKERPLEIKRYWRAEDYTNLSSIKEEEYENTFRSLLNDSVRLNLISDVKVGTSLSGGLDSTSIAALISNNIESSQLQDSISYSSKYKEFDESEYIKDFIKEKNINNKIIAKSVDQFWDDIKKLVYYQEEPFVSTGMYAGFSVMEMANKSDLKVMLNGQGADEILGGYRKYKIFYLKEMIKKGKFIKALKCVLSIRFQMGKSYNLKDDIKKIKNIFKKQKESTMSGLLNETFKKERSYPLKPRKTFLDMLIGDVYETSLPALLRYEDKNSMAWSVEARVPFLDHRLVEFCFGLPTEWKMNGGWSKWILRSSMKDLLPSKIINRKDKMGFVTEQSIWLAQNKENIKDLFNDENTRSGKFIHLSRLRKNIDDLLNPERGHNIWRIINLELWLREFF